MADTPATTPQVTEPIPPDRPTLSVRILLSWTMAGAVAAGGFFVAGLILARGDHGLLSPSGVLLLSLVGALLGLVHGSLLALVGHRPEVTTRHVMKRLVMGAVWAIPAFAVAGILAFWIAIGAQALAMSRPTLLVVLAAAASLPGIAICVWAAYEGRRAMRNAFARWPERRLGVPLLLLAFVTILVAFLVVRPEIWWTDVRVTPLGAVLLATGVTIWFAIPVAWIALHLLSRWRT